MKIKAITLRTGLLVVIMTACWSCTTLKVDLKEADVSIPEYYNNPRMDSSTVAHIKWREYFNDEQLALLIDSALVHNQELNIVLQEIAISKNEVLEKQGEYLPFVDVGIGAGTEKPGRFTRDGAVEHNLEIVDGQEIPEPLGDIKLGLSASWEVDIWRKLRNAKDAAQMNYLAQTEGSNFLKTQLVAEVAELYYELIAMDNLLEIINRNVSIQSDALYKARLMKTNAKVNQLAVNRFEAQLLNTQYQQYAIKQKRTETENRLHYLTGSYPHKISRSTRQLMDIAIDSFQVGIPSQLLENRPDIRQAEYSLAAARLNVRSAKANFYPKLDLSAGSGFQAFNPQYLVNPESLIFNAVGDLIAPVINRKAIKAQYNTATAQQIQAVYTYEQTLLNAYTDVLNQLAKLNNSSQSLTTKMQEVKVLNESVEIANSLFLYARADYVEVLLTQEEVLDAQMELIETKLRQVHSKVQLYRALGGGWN